ncbi:MAG: AAA family ATPase, partial [Dehalococcoidia bacterium]
MGRDREMALLRGQVDAALQGEGSLVLITGEAGIGKTRLASEARSYARSRGFLWLKGRYANEGNMPYQAWVEAVRGFLRYAPPELLEKVPLPYGAELSRLVPEVAERLVQMPSLPSLGPEEERLRLFEAQAGFFCAIAEEQPLVLFLDDLQWAPSIDTLHHLARNLAGHRLLVLGAYRDVELMEKAALTRTFLAMNRERLFQSVALKRLQEAEVTQMVGQILTGEPSGSLAQVIYEKTEGNPFFVEEVTRYLSESGSVTWKRTGWELGETAVMDLPISVKAVVGEKLERLGEESNGVLTWAAVAGQEFTLLLLQKVAGLDEEGLLQVIDSAESARVLLPRPSRGQEVYAFADNQTWEVLYEGISTARRRRYHLRVGQAIEEVHARHLEEHYGAMAHHFLEGNDLEKAAEYASKAGDRAARVYSWRAAIGQYQTALELLEELDAEPLQRAGVLEKLALVTGLSQGSGAVGYWEKALSNYEALGDGKKAADVHLRLGQRGGGVSDRGVRRSHNLYAVELLETEVESPQLALAYVQLGDDNAHGYGPISTAVPLMEKGLALAERLSDVPAVIEASSALGHVLVYHTGEIRRGLELFQRGCEEARQVGNLVTLSEAASGLSREFAYLRDAAEALHWAEQ